MTELLLADVVSQDPVASTRVTRLSTRARLLARAEGLGTWIGVVLIGSGAVLLALAWAESSQETTVARQLPWIVSAGFTGVGLLVVGVVAISLDAKVRESKQRRNRADELSIALGRIQRALEEQTR